MCSVYIFRWWDFCSQSQRCISPCTSKHGFSPDYSVGDSGWPLPSGHIGLRTSSNEDETEAFQNLKTECHTKSLNFLHSFEAFMLTSCFPTLLSVFSRPSPSISRVREQPISRFWEKLSACMCWRNANRRIGLRVKIQNPGMNRWSRVIVFIDFRV